MAWADLRVSMSAAERRPAWLVGDPRDVEWDALVDDLTLRVGLERGHAARAVDAWRAVGRGPVETRRWIELCAESGVDPLQLARDVAGATRGKPELVEFFGVEGAIGA